MSLHTFDPKDLVLTVGGVAISGFADGEFVSVERESDTFNKSTGADGDVTRVKQNDKSGMIVITLMQTSLSNDVLMGFHKLDEESNGGVVPVLAKDLNGTALFFSQQAWVRKPPTANYAKELQNREWTLDCGELEVFVGGTTPNAV